MGRRAARIDANQPEIVKALRDVGASVQSIASIGQGCPDLLVGYREQTFVMEVKDGAKPPSERKLTDDERDWHADWRGQLVIVESVDDALRAIGALE